MPVTQSKQRSIVEQLADVGEEAIQRIGTALGGDRLLGGVNSMRDRLDDLQKRVRGLEEHDKRLAAMERRLDKLEGRAPSSTGTTSSSSKKRSTTRKTDSG
jgi:tetrahydromethanopterin S-methyltransferase subunit G